MVIATGVLISEFEAGAAVFNPVTWETHLLNLEAVEILKTTGADGSSTEMEADVLMPPDSVDQCIEQLFSLGLLEEN